MRRYLKQQKKAGVTAIPALGYQMVSEKFPDPGCTLSQEIITGAPFGHMSKLKFIDPDKIDEAFFSMGGHSANLKGTVKYPESDQLLNLHYKLLGFEYVSGRNAVSNVRRNERDRKKGSGYNTNIIKPNSRPISIDSAKRWSMLPTPINEERIQKSVGGAKTPCPIPVR